MISFHYEYITLVSCTYSLYTDTLGKVHNKERGSRSNSLISIVITFTAIRLQILINLKPMILQSIAFHQLIKSPDVLVQARQTIDAIVDSAPSLLPHKSIRMSIKSF